MRYNIIDPIKPFLKRIEIIQQFLYQNNETQGYLARERFARKILNVFSLSFHDYKNVSKVRILYPLQTW